MLFSEITVILRWLLALWALGWLVLPLSSRLLPFLPDKGLAAGRAVAVALLCLLCFWGASLHLVPLDFAPLLWVAAPLLVATGWRSPGFRSQLRANRRHFLFSDLVFLACFGLLLWVRLRHPEANDLEKPMDMALLSSAMRAVWLPFENPWFSGTPFTNYYYFGPLMGGLIARTLATPPFQAYNLVLSLFGAFFLSVLWSLGAALGRGAKVGIVVMLLVGLGGHFEPLRQIQQTHQWWPLDWWKTSRVIDNTINEYPAFTLFAGDLHAHFYAFSLAVTFFCLCFGLLQVQSKRLRLALLLVSGLFLGVLALTNTWDVPLYGLLWLGCVLWNVRHSKWSRADGLVLLGAFGVAPLAALPYFLKFKSQVSGVAFDFWIPGLFSFCLLWGSWWMLGCVALALPEGEEKPTEAAIFRRLLIGVGMLALLFPFFFYIRGAFGDGDLRHQDTVFKFGLQAWLLLGTGIAAEVGFRASRWWQQEKWPVRAAFTLAAAVFGLIVSLAPVCVAWTRATRDAPLDENGHHILSLNAARFLPEDELKAIEWLRQNAAPGETVLEAVARNPDGSLGGDYNPLSGHVASFSGVPDYLGWPQHVMVWGTPWDKVLERDAVLSSIYQGRTEAQVQAALEQAKATYVFSGMDERLQGSNLAFLSGRVKSLQVVPGFEENLQAAQILRFQR